MFWTDVTNHRIMRARLNGSQQTTLVNTGLCTPCKQLYGHLLFFKIDHDGGYKQILIFSTDGVAWDWVGEKLYWTDECNNEIEVYDPATQNRKVLIDTGSSSNPRGIVVDPGTRYVIKYPG